MIPTRAIQIRPKSKTPMAKTWPLDGKERLWAWVKWYYEGKGKNRQAFVAGFTVSLGESDVADVYFPEGLEEGFANEVNAHFNFEPVEGQNSEGKWTNQWEVRIWEEKEEDEEGAEVGEIEKPSTKELVRLEAQGLLENSALRKRMPLTTAETLKALKAGKIVDWPELAQLSAFLLEELSQRPKPLSVAVRSLCRFIAERHERLLSDAECHRAAKLVG